ncbi:RNA-binding motif protein, X-linked 2 [Trichoderma lentiforme]|uniref:RNA-binding motif protein, X-linked 2 n=1 Tax=Trichoderma lentiforme TaxID=1567552 RepID=A0A9P4X9L4_9HYPO|nr:RNA-binding motif protein, X-linked 2 [Trichoderma lentiforme]
MNQIRAIQALNKKEIENGMRQNAELTCRSSPDASWHVDYRDTAFVYFGGLPYELSEGDIITIFSQFGEPVFLKLVRDKETGKSKGFGWLKYEDQRSTDLAVDNLGGAEIGGRLLRVDHARYQARDDEDQDEFKIGWEDIQRREGKAVSDDESIPEEIQRPILPEERELALLMRDHDNDDPMKGFLIDEKKKEVEEARRRADRKEKPDSHRHHRHHKSRRDKEDDGRRERSRRDEASGEKEKRPSDGESRRYRHRDDSRERHRRHRDSPREGSRERERRRDKKPEYDDRRSHRKDDDRERHRRRREEDDDDDGRRRSQRKSRSRSPRRRQN